ncbi:MAG: DUF222 domain-containing protein [Frankiales bacterium]|nr:DUF222 domain-containing protein [Frankiales bacterium]
MALVLSPAVADLVSAADKLRADDSVITDPDMMLGDAEALLEVVATAQAVLVRRLQASDAVSATAELTGRGTRAWLHEEQLLAGPQAAQLARLARELPAYPATQAALDAGEVNTGHASAILTALRSLPAEIRETVEPDLVDRARLHPPEEIAGFVDELLQALGLDKASEIRREQRLADRHVDLTRTFDGTRSLTGTLTPEVGAKLEAALAIAAQPAGAEDNRSRAQRNHDALGVIADTFLAAQTVPPSFTGSPRTLIVTIDLDVLEGRLHDAHVLLPDGAQISADTARRLACDAELIPAVLGARSEVLDIGQADHEFTAPIRRAAYLRDRGRCAFPDCRNKPSELHHIVFRRHRGPTSLDNAAWLCGYHHWLTHEGHWTLHRAEHGGYQWTSPRGRVVERRLPGDSGLLVDARSVG